MILLIDNYDSFSFNLYQMIGEISPDIQVIRNDELSVTQIQKLNPQAIILSPGPGRPDEAGILEEVIPVLGKTTPILGICLGHQAICEVFGADIVHASRLMHGKQSILDFDSSHFLFENCTSPFLAARYHSLAADENGFPEDLKILATSEDGQIMAVEHKEYPIYGLQFHPESILSPQGKTILENFVKEALK